MDTNWFNCKKDEARITYSPREPYEFLNVGTNPLDGMTLKTAQKYDIFLNVALESLYSHDAIKPKQNTKYFHVPINEDNFWGYEPFLKTKIILDKAFEGGEKTYLHCHSGANRSPTIALFWIFSKEGNLYRACSKLSNNPTNLMKRIAFYQNLNFIPKELEKFYERYEKYGYDIERIINTEPKIKTDFKAIH
jgi:protein-tyrosine phosphatase